MTRRIAMALIGCAVVVLGCPRPKAPTIMGYHLDQMEELGSHLVYLTAQVQASAALGSLPGGSDREKIAFATRNDPQSRAPFESYRVLVAEDGGNAAVLVCTSDGAKALFEDLGCTPRLDVKHWQEPNPPACAFTMSLRDACAGR